ncbi:hypothetical protein D3C76_1177560 [compost metagenome]
MKARLTAIVGAIQGFEANQAACRLAHRRRLGRRDAGQADLAQAAGLAHAQAERRVAGQLNGAMTQAHVARNRQPGTRFAEAGGIEAVLLQQRLRVCAMAANGVRQAMDEADRQITEPQRLRFHGL